MVLRDDKSDDGYHWECPVNQCRKRRSIRAGSLIDKSNKKSIATDRIATSYRHHGTSEAQRHLLFENSTWQLEVGWLRKNNRD